MYAREQCIIDAFDEQIHFNSLNKKYGTDETVVNHIDKICTLDFLKMIQDTKRDDEGLRYILIVADKSSKYG